MLSQLLVISAIVWYLLGFAGCIVMLWGQEGIEELKIDLPSLILLVLFCSLFGPLFLAGAIQTRKGSW